MNRILITLALLCGAARADTGATPPPNCAKLDDIPCATAACEKNNGPMCTVLALHYQKGDAGVHTQPVMARALMRKACDLGVGDACGAYGVYLYNAEGGRRDTLRAFEYWKKGCKLGSQFSCEKEHEDLVPKWMKDPNDLPDWTKRQRANPPEPIPVAWEAGGGKRVAHDPDEGVTRCKKGGSVFGAKDAACAEGELCSHYGRCVAEFKFPEKLHDMKNGSDCRVGGDCKSGRCAIEERDDLGDFGKCRAAGAARKPNGERCQKSSECASNDCGFKRQRDTYGACQHNPGVGMACNGYGDYKQCSMDVPGCTGGTCAMENVQVIIPSSPKVESEWLPCASDRDCKILANDVMTVGGGDKLECKKVGAHILIEDGYGGGPWCVVQK
jgi:hypothetical protein